MPRKSNDFLETYLMLLAYLDQKGGEADLQEVEKCLGLSKDMIKKMGKTVKMVGVPPYTPSELFDLELDETENKVRLQSPVDVNLPLALNAREAFELIFALLTFKEYLISTSELYCSLIDRLIKSAPNLLVEAVKRELETHKPHLPKGKIRELAGTLSNAISSRKKVRFVYYSLAGSQLKEYTVLPLKISYFFKSFYLWAVDDEDGKIKSFLLDNIGRFEVTTFKFQISEEIMEDLKEKEREFVRHEEIPRVTLKAKGFAAQYISEIYSNLNREWVNERELLFKVPFLSLEWLLCRWILPFGGQVEIIEPEKTKYEIESLLEKFLEKIQK
jgi:predicted DNA-binding transcriptional regulator YafY